MDNTLSQNRTKRRAQNRELVKKEPPGTFMLSVRLADIFTASQLAMYECANQYNVTVYSTCMFTCTALVASERGDHHGDHLRAGATDTSTELVATNKSLLVITNKP